MNNLINKNVLITTSAWFYAPDGKQYRSVWGTLKSVQEDTTLIGFKVNRSHANYVYEVGNMLIMGCQVMYIIQADDITFDRVEDYQVHDGKYVLDYRPSAIYNANIF